ncbi:hypothetical protein QBC40DRAFT_173286 [Triangularia verruculosa]|uniref:C2H2-type domain-containing protein n=1 Tax=Triangularia verruculosa TaxID=2587418 RepID=A0AAN7AX70_9PEZI|nr:hypothetical protein QBC40DRAFT_173286 [Triangularia verruculosa]
MSQPLRYSYAHAAEQSAASSDPSGMTGLARQSGAGINSFSGYGVNMNGFGAYGARHGQQQNPVTTTLGPTDLSEIDRIVKNSQRPVTVTAPSHPFSWRASEFTDPIYTDFRSNAPPSEVETLISPVGEKLISDSGYGSQIRSVGNRSVYNGEIDNHETQIITQQLSQYGLSQVTNDNRPRRRDAPSQRAGSTTSTANNLRCDDCPNVTFKTNSEFRKHKARHEKPFKCDIPGCLKASDGFSTNNDLDRHRAGVHKIYKSDTPVYRCYIQSCKDKEKIWPRPDNFRQHLRRVHHMQTFELSQFQYRCVALPLAIYTGSTSVTSEYAPSDAGRHSRYAGHQTSWNGLGHSQGMSNVHHVPDEPAVVQPQHLMYHSTMSQTMSQPDYSSFMNTSGFQSQTQGTLDVPRMSMDVELQGLISREFQQQVGPAVQEQASEQQDHVSPDILTGAGSGLCTLDETGEMHPHPVEVIQLDDESLDATQEEGFAQQPKDDHVVSISPDMMTLDHPAPADDEAESEENEPEHPAVESFDRLTKISEQNIHASDLEDARKLQLLAGPSPEDSTGHSSASVDLDEVEMTAKAKATLESLKTQDQSLLDRILLQLGYQKSEEQATKDPETPSAPPSVVATAASTESTKEVKCDIDDCNKTFQRPCELKKHQKRHAKPYACTFAKCDKRFGSKNDWKRHENSQHFQLEIWRCTEPVYNHSSSDFHECSKVCHRRESLKSHLERDHGFQDAAAVEKKLADCRLGRNFESRFWCGFCVKTIEPQGSGGPAHSERFDHIDRHFMGKQGFEKADIKDWKSLEMVADQEMQLRNESAAGDQQDGASRKRGREDGGDGRSGKRLRGKGRAEKVEIFWTCVSLSWGCFLFVRGGFC